MNRRICLTHGQIGAASASLSHISAVRQRPADNRFFLPVVWAAFTDLAELPGTSGVSSLGQFPNTQKIKVDQTCETA